MNSKRVRLELLAGFIDSDGTVPKGNTTYAVISQELESHGHLIDDLQYIARSLGFRAEVGIRIHVRPNGRKSTMKELGVSGFNIEKIPTRVPRKKLSPRSVKSRNPLCCQIKVAPVGKGQYVGWHIDRNERFLLGDFTVTHNTRNEGGKDAAAARYIATMEEEITRVIFSAHDNALLEHLVEDDEPVEYKFFMPIIPMLLVNGAKGVASGFSTDIPNYNPLNIVEWIETWLDPDRNTSDLEEMVPWYRGFTGEVELVKTKTGKAVGWWSKGILEVGSGKGKKGWWHIRELPIGVWTKPFETWLEYLETGVPPKGKKWKKKDVRGLSDIRSYCTANRVHFMIKPTKDFKPDMDTPGNLKIMQKNRSLKNMVAIDENDYPHRFDSPEDVLRFFCPRRLKYYQLRKDHILGVLNRDLLKASNKYRFVKGIVNKKLELHQTKAQLEKTLSSKLWRFDKISTGAKASPPSYEYLLSMQMRSMTVEKLKELRQEDDKLTDEIETVKGKSARDLWLEDLKNFREAYKKFLETRCEE